MSANQPEYQDIKNMVSQLASTVDSLRKELNLQTDIITQVRTIDDDVSCAMKLAT